MNSRERIKNVLEHNQPDKLPVDFGSSPVTGMHVHIVYKLRQYYGLDKPSTPVKVIEPFQMLGEIANDLKEIIGVDVANLESKGTFFGYKKENWKEWTLWDGTPVLVPELFNTDVNPDGSVFQYAEGNKSYPPSSKMPKGGYFFDSIIRQKPLKEEDLNPLDNTEEFKVLTESNLEYIKTEANKIYYNTNYAILGVVASSGFGDIAFIPGPMLPDPKGIRDIEEWYISTVTRKEYLKKVFHIQCEIAIENYKKVYDAVGDKIAVVYISGTDFGTQDRLFSSIDSYKELIKPFQLKINNWIHENTSWKCFIHSCGAIFELMPELIDAGFDVFNPVQISARGMEPEKLKRTYGKYVTFWGGGIDTQKTLAFGSTNDVRNETERLINIFNKDGGFVFSAVHNIQCNVPIENIVAMIEVIRKYR